METTPYIGASISLVSKAGIRYEGTLFTIDTQQSNLALQNGACQFHTGERVRGGGAVAVPWQRGRRGCAGAAPGCEPP